MCTVSVVSLFRLDLAHNLGVGDFPATNGCDLVVQNGEEGVDTFDALTIVGTNALAYAPKFVCIGGILGSGEGGVSPKLAPFKEVAFAFI